MKLKYIGQAFIPGIPARDLTEEEVEKYGGVDFLLATGLYQQVEEKAPHDKALRKYEVKNGHQGVS